MLRQRNDALVEAAFNSNQPGQGTSAGKADALSDSVQTLPPILTEAMREHALDADRLDGGSDMPRNASASQYLPMRSSAYPTSRPMVVTTDESVGVIGCLGQKIFSVSRASGPGSGQSLQDASTNSASRSSASSDGRFSPLVTSAAGSIRSSGSDCRSPLRPSLNWISPSNPARGRSPTVHPEVVHAGVTSALSASNALLSVLGADAVQGLLSSHGGYIPSESWERAQAVEPVAMRQPHTMPPVITRERPCPATSLDVEPVLVTRAGSPCERLYRASSASAGSAAIAQAGSVSRSCSTHDLAHAPSESRLSSASNASPRQRLRCTSPHHAQFAVPVRKISPGKRCQSPTQSRWVLLSPNLGSPPVAAVPLNRSDAVWPGMSNAAVVGTAALPAETEPIRRPSCAARVVPGARQCQPRLILERRVCNTSP